MERGSFVWKARVVKKICVLLYFGFLFSFVSYLRINSQDESSTCGDDPLLRFERDISESNCGVNLTVESDGGTLTSPNYPQLYPSNIDCRWLLTTDDPQDDITLRIKVLLLEEHRDCKLDYLQVYAGPSSLSPSLGSFCGNRTNLLLPTNSSQVLIVFHSDPTYEDKGFSIDYFTQNTAECVPSLRGSSGTVKSPGFPKNYPDSTDCWTLISVNRGQTIDLSFDTLDLEYGENCTFDYVRIFDGSTREAPLLDQLCRSSRDDSFQSSSHSLLLHFHSDVSVNRKGFRAHYNAFNPRKRGTTDYGECLWEKDDFNGTIASPNYPGNYPSLSNCSIWLMSEDSTLVTLEFETIQLEAETNCSFDFLQVRNVADSNILGTFCGKPGELKEFTWNTNGLHIVFQTDDFAEFSGFKLRYWFHTNSTDEPHNQTNKDSNRGGASHETVRLAEFPKNATLEIGASHVLPCSTHHPNAKIRWLKDDKFLAGNNPLPGLKLAANGSLWIQRMDHHLAGVYACVAVSPEGSEHVNAWVQLQNDASMTTTCSIVFRKKPKDSSFAEGEFAYLECLAAGTQIVVSWEKDGVPLHKSKRVTIMKNGFVFLDQVTLDDSGVYSCVAYDAAANCRKRATAVLSVSKRAKIEEICGIPKVAQPSKDAPRSDHGKIVGGHNALKGAFPWQVMLWEPQLESFCGASLINERWIITAAHCFDSYENLQWSRIVIKLGKHDSKNEEREEITTGIADRSSIIIHPAYSRKTYDNDLALVRLRDHVPFTDYISPVCLGDASLLEGDLPLGTVTGWGKLKYKGATPRFLQEIILPVVNHDVCAASTDFTVSRNMFCAGYAQEILGDACHGDSGGPFVMSYKGRWNLLGIVSWGEGCGKANKYGFYTKVSNYLPWIKGIIKI